MCGFGFLKGDAFTAQFKSPLTDDMIPGLLDQIHELAGYGTMVSYGGGEPLLCHSLMDWLEQAKRLKLDFRFTSNGYTIDAGTAQRLVSAGLFNIGVSLESLDPDINEIIRPYSGGTAKTIQAIELLLEEKRHQKSGISINIKVTLTQLNMGCIVDIVRRWGLIEGVIVTPQMFEVDDSMPEGTKQRLWIKDIGRIETVVGELKKLKSEGYHINADDQALDDCVTLYRNDPGRKSTIHNRTVTAEDRPPCTIGTDSLYIIDGAVRLCPFFPDIGSLLSGNQSLKKLWFSEKAREIRLAMRKCRTVCTLSCTRRVSLLAKVKLFLKM